MGGGVVGGLMVVGLVCVCVYVCVWCAYTCNVLGQFIRDTEGGNR
jgi:hypothetical protein